MKRPEWTASISEEDFRWITAEPITEIGVSAVAGMVILSRGRDKDGLAVSAEFLNGNGYIEYRPLDGSLVSLTSLGAVAMRKIKEIDEWRATVNQQAKSIPPEVHKIAELPFMGTDASRWAAAFNVVAKHLGYSDMDEGWLIAWFVNAIEAGHTAGLNKYADLGPIVLKDQLDRLNTFLAKVKTEIDHPETSYDKGKIAAYGYVQQWIEQEQERQAKEQPNPANADNHANDVMKYMDINQRLDRARTQEDKACNTAGCNTKVHEEGTAATLETPLDIIAKTVGEHYDGDADPFSSWLRTVSARSRSRYQRER